MLMLALFFSSPRRSPADPGRRKARKKKTGPSGNLPEAGKMFQAQLGKMMEVCIVDMVLKSKRSHDHLEDLSQTFDIIRRFQLELNASKCAFGVSSGKFQGSLDIGRRIEANLD
ncbi:hypothetical protein AAC387_Pa07g2097 [Persea americana]